MGKKAASRKRVTREEEVSQERRSKARHERGPSTLSSVSSMLTPLFHSNEALRAFKETFHARHILDGKSVKFDELETMYASQHVDTANFLALHGWVDFVKVKKPIYDTLLRILMSNLDATTMISWIGKKKVDLSVDAWCRMFNIPFVTPEEESFIENLHKGELFFRLTGERNLGIRAFIRTNQLHQEPSVRLSNQIVMNVLVPKKGSKEQIKHEEGKLLYAMMYGAEINLAQMIVDRIRGVVGRKSSPICYPMHLVEMMEKAGVNLTCAGDDPRHCKSEINHHTLKRLGYKFRHGGWDFVGKGHVNESFGDRHSEHRGQEEEEEEEDRTLGGGRDTQEETTLPTQGESSAPSQPRSTPASLHFLSQIAHLATKTEIANLKSFIAQQFEFLQITLMSKLDSMEERIQSCEAKLSQSQPPQPTPHDPKGKAPLHPSPVSIPSSPSSPLVAAHSPHIGETTQPIHTTSHHSQTQHLSPPPSAQPEPPSKSPQPQPATSQTSQNSTASKFELVARTPQTQALSTDSEATKSDSFLATPTPPLRPTPSSPQSAPTKQFTTAYQRRKKPATSS